MNARSALALAALVQWDAWRLLAGRIEDAGAAIMLLVLAIGLIGMIARGSREARVPPVLVAAGLATYAVACVTGPALLQIGVATSVLALLSRATMDRPLPCLPLVGLSLLALPVISSLEFLLAWPLRRLSALLAAGLLNMNGLVVGLEGVALEWQGRQLLFDAPCSGVRMLWTCWLLVSVLALAGRFAPGRYALAIGGATLLAVAGNALRAASLFYLENGFLAPLEGPIAHEVIGMLAFLLVALAAAVGVTRLTRRRVTCAAW